MRSTDWAVSSSHLAIIEHRQRTANGENQEKVESRETRIDWIEK